VTAPSSPTRPTITAERYSERISAAQATLPGEDAAALLVGVGADLQWLIGYAAKDLERLTMLVLPATGRGTLIVPRLERAAAEAAPGVAAQAVDVATWEETEDPFELVAARLEDSNSRPEIQLGALGGAWGRLGGLLVSDRLWATFLLRLQSAVPDAAFGLASAVLGPLRAVKDAEEIALLREAARAADRVVEAIARGRLVGRTEADVAREVRDRLVDEGHDFASFWIVASGPNSASPHHEPTERVIQAGEPIVIDIGGSVSGYCSDITRTVWVTGDADDRPSDDFARLYEVLQRAQHASRDAVRPGVECQQVDVAARSVITDAGMGELFIHRTGHGIGLEGHEDPYMVAGNDEPLEVGNAFSIEPGIYVEGRHGARIEDICVCSAEGADSLNQVTRDLLIVRG
jgi:Xaa-Pro aminopeptidase